MLEVKRQLQTEILMLVTTGGGNLSRTKLQRSRLRSEAGREGGQGRPLALPSPSGGWSWSVLDS
jgi:hypothetical protein